jgi:glycerol dehydrogenase
LLSLLPLLLKKPKQKKNIIMNDSQKTKLYKAVFPGKYIQSENALAELPGLISIFGKKGLILASPKVKASILPKCNRKYSGFPADVEEFSGECCQSELKRLTDIVNEKHIDVLVGMGGGKTIDTAKIVADKAGIPVIVVPTIASTDAPCSGCAVIYNEQGIFESVYYQKQNPQVVLMDLNVIAFAPVRFLVAGMGDALATWFEARSCEETSSHNECGGYSTLTGLHLAKLCYDTLLKYGKEAKTACKNHTVTPALNFIVEANTLLSGIGFESSGLAAAHSVHNGLTAMEETHSFYHGEKVAFGVLTGLYLSSASPGEIETVYSFCEEIGLPTTLSDIGIKKIEKNRLMKVAVKACASSEGIHHETGNITPEKVLNAMITANNTGLKRKLSQKKINQKTVISVTENIKLKPIELSDAADIYNTIDSQREYLGQWLPFVEFTRKPEYTLQFVRSIVESPVANRDYIFVIHYDDSFVGLIGLKSLDNLNKRTEIGYWLSEPFQKKGIVTKAVEVLTDFAFRELNMNRIQIKCATENFRSKKIPQRLGFRLEGIERAGELLTGGHFADLEVYSKLKTE